MIIADTSGLLALFNRLEPAHHAVAQAVGGSVDPLVVSPYVIAELDYLVAPRLGVDSALAVLSELTSDAYLLAALDSRDVERCAAVVGKYRDQQIGVTDASIVVLAERHDTRSILTLDRRHFEVVRPLNGGRFRLIPG